ncbi:MAG: ATPase, T2SS/T4P/T4SS family [Traorella sp.]
MEKLLCKLIFESQKVQASDVHFMINNQICNCEMRGINGFISFESERLFQLFQFLKYKANLDLGNQSKPQSGTFELVLNQKLYYFRFSCINMFQIQTGVLRILNNHPILSINELSYKKSQNSQFKKWCNQRTGFVVFSGPTGSGKTTTLHVLLEEIARKKKHKIITLEDPIEIISENYLQLQINEKIDFTYEEGIKQLLRHDPDILMIGEIRDEKCAEMAYRASLSGHMIFTTLHAKSCTEAIKRLLELGLTKENLQNTLTAVINQRLYPNTTHKERLCIYEILTNDTLQNYLESGKLENHKTIQDEIQDAIKKNIIKIIDAKADL